MIKTTIKFIDLFLFFFLTYPFHSGIVEFQSKFSKEYYIDFESKNEKAAYAFNIYGLSEMGSKTKIR